MNITAYCSVNSKQSNAPGTKTYNVRLVTLGATPTAASPNAAVLVGPQPINLEIPNLSAAAAAEFDAGDTVQISITKVTPSS